MDRSVLVVGGIAIVSFGAGLACGAHFLAGKGETRTIVVERPAAAPQRVPEVGPAPLPVAKVPDPPPVPAGPVPAGDGNPPGEGPALGADGRPLVPYGGYNGKPGLFQVEIRNEEDRFLDGFHDAVPTLEQVQDIVVKEGEEGYVSRIVESRLKALKGILGDEWVSSGVEPNVRGFYEEWARQRWKVHKDYVEAARDAKDDLMRVKRRMLWATKWSEMAVEQAAQLPVVLSLERYQRFEAKVDRVCQYTE